MGHLHGFVGCSRALQAVEAYRVMMRQSRMNEEEREAKDLQTKRHGMEKGAAGGRYARLVSGRS